MTTAGAVAKMTLSSGFVITALAVGALDTRWGTWLFAGLVASWLGDLALTRRGKGPFITGLGAFTAAHVSYLIAFLDRGLSPRATVVAAAAMAAVGAAALVWLRPHAPGLFGGLAVYVAAITAMVAGAVGTHIYDTTWPIVVGASGFAASDVAVARQRFVSPSPINRRWGLPLYFVSQFLVAIGAGG